MGRLLDGHQGAREHGDDVRVGGQMYLRQDACARIRLMFDDRERGGGFGKIALAQVQPSAVVVLERLGFSLGAVGVVDTKVAGREVCDGWHFKAQGNSRLRKRGGEYAYRHTNVLQCILLLCGHGVKEPGKHPVRRWCRADIVVGLS